MRVVMKVAIVLFLCARPVCASDLPNAVVSWPNGDRLSGELVSNSGGVITLSTPTVGEISVKSAGLTLTIVDPPVPASDDRSSSDEPVAVQDPSPDELTEDEPNPWTGSISLAASTSRAANTASNIRLGGSLRRKDDSGKTELAGTWYWNQSKGATLDNDILVRGTQEWYIKESRWLYFAQGTWQYDQFESWGHRVSPYAGVGYKWYEEDDLTMTLKSGGGVTWQYNTGTITPQLLFELNTDWKINDLQSLIGIMSIAPDPVDWGNYLATIQADWKLKLASDTPWAFSLGVRSIYDSRPSGGNGSNDFKAYAGLTMDF